MELYSTDFSRIRLGGSDTIVELLSNVVDGVRAHPCKLSSYFAFTIDKYHPVNDERNEPVTA